MKVVLPLRAEFGMLCWWHAPVVHAIEGPKVVYIEQGLQALYPSAECHIEVERQVDALRRNGYKNDAEFIEATAADARVRYPDGEMLRPYDGMPKRRFIPRPTVQQGVTCDVVVCPRKRDYGPTKNWPSWFDLTTRLNAEGLSVFAGGAHDSSFDVPCAKAWDFDRGLDATLEAMHSARLVVSTDAGLAHLAVLAGRPLLMITHAKGRVAPGPVIGNGGREIAKRYWPVHEHRYREGNHTGSPFTMLHDAWFDVDLVVRETLARAR